MAVCPLILNFFHMYSQKWLVFANNLASQTFYPNWPILFTRIYPSYPWHFPTLCSRLSGSNLHNNSRLLRELYQVVFFRVWSSLQFAIQRVVSLEQRNCQQEIRLGQVCNYLILVILVNVIFIMIYVILNPLFSSSPLSYIIIILNP